MPRAAAELGLVVLLGVEPEAVPLAAPPLPIEPPKTLAGAEDELVLAAASLYAARVLAPDLGGLITPTMPPWQ